MIQGFLTLHDCTSLVLSSFRIAKCWALGYTLKSGYGDRGNMYAALPDSIRKASSLT
jgi:hypothetical protein